MRQRIQTIDGLRFLAALGVLWIHSWKFHGNPRFYIGPVDIAGLLAIGGNGVDLFFVISGFCMYYFYGSKSKFSYADFYRFVLKRWVRLSPAFYAAAFVYIVVYAYPYHTGHRNAVVTLLNSIFYLNSVFPRSNAAPHFWTLGVEWQFYFTIPFLLIYQCSAGFKKTFMIIFGVLMMLAVVSVFMLKNQSDLLTYQLLFRGIEFGFGILAARMLLKNTLFFPDRALWLILFIVFTFAGRVLIAKPVLHLAGNYYNLFKLPGFALMGAGFSGILYLSVTSVKWLNLILGNLLFRTLGRISYSFYLWHALVQPVAGNFTIKYIPFATGIMAPVMTTILSAAILYPISLLSYKLLEKPFLYAGNLTTK